MSQRGLIRIGDLQPKPQGALHVCGGWLPYWAKLSDNALLALEHRAGLLNFDDDRYSASTIQDS